MNFRVLALLSGMKSLWNISALKTLASNNIPAMCTSADREFSAQTRSMPPRGPRFNIGKAKSVDRGEEFKAEKSVLFPKIRKPLSGLPDISKPHFTVLGIETSCDDTGVAVLSSDGKILGESLASQQSVHESWGGVVPGLAMEAHREKIDETIRLALNEAGMTSVAEIDAIAVTVGPGLEICLRVGCEKAKKLAIEYEKPFVAVHHLEAHVMLARAPITEPFVPVNFPFLSLLISGGHCQLLLCKGVGDFVVLGGTLDDALGEAFDKVARLLGLPVGGGGGPQVENRAKMGDPDSIKLPVPMAHKQGMNFSFAGLKNSFRMSLDNYKMENGVGDALPDEVVNNFAASFQRVAISHLEQRLGRAMEHCSSLGVDTLAVVGGVAANAEVRKRIEGLCESQDRKWKLVIPPPRLCTDNGVMIAWSAIEKLKLGISNEISAQEVYPRIPLGPIAKEAE